MAQTGTSGLAFYQLNPNLLPETKWKYTFTLHLESNTILHQAGDAYEYFLYFKYNNTFEQFLNGERSVGKWSIEDNELKYTFKKVEVFRIIRLDREVMVLEFEQPFSKGHFQYQFVAQDDENVPFVKPENELPLVKVDLAGKREKGLFSFKKKRKRKRKTSKRKRSQKIDEPYISIELAGGGYYGGIDPVIKDYIEVKSDGRLIKEFQSIEQGLIVTKKNIPRIELEMLVEYAKAQGFFDFQRSYDCNDSLCKKRKSKSPRPIPLRLAITHGDERKLVTVAVWGQDHHRIQYVNYPSALDQIVDAIQRMAHRTGDSISKK